MILIFAVSEALAADGDDIVFFFGVNGLALAVTDRVN